MLLKDENNLESSYPLMFIIMKHRAKSIRTFIGAMNYEESKSFYRELGFEEFVISHDMSYFRVCETLGFSLQDYYVNSSEGFKLRG